MTRREPPLRVLHVLAAGFGARTGYAVRSRAILEVQLADPGFEPVAALVPLRAGGDPTSEIAIEGVAIAAIPHPADSPARLPLPDRLCRGCHRLRKRAQQVFERRPAGAGDRPAAVHEPSARRGNAGSLPSRGARSFGRALVAIEERLLLRRHHRELVRMVGEHRPDLLHAHSPHGVARSAIRAARSTGLPLVYEVRGLWEESAVAEGSQRRGDRRYRRWRRRETEAMHAADAVVAIGEALREEILARGLAAEKVFLAPNGAPTPGAVPDETSAMDDEMAEGRKARGPFVLGYVGSIRALEGLELLVRGVAAMRDRGIEVDALLVGGGEAAPALAELARDLGVSAHVKLVGSVPHGEVGRYYRRIDAVVLPRLDMPVTRIVSPLKPLEAMAFGKPVVASDVPALAEVVADGETGLLFRPGSIQHFVEQCTRLAGDHSLSRRLSEAARSWVGAHRTWPAALSNLPAAYAAARAGRRYQPRPKHPQPIS